MAKSDWDYRGLAAECYDLWFGEEPFWDQAFSTIVCIEMVGAPWKLPVGRVASWCRFCGMGLPSRAWMRPGVLEMCRHKATQVGVTPILYQQLMQDLELDRQYRTLYSGLFFPDSC